MKLSLLFTSSSPADFAQKIGIPVGWFVLPHLLVESMTDRRNLHGKWCCIKSDKGTVFRVLRFSPRLKSITNAEIVLDWAAWIELNGKEEDVTQPLSLKIEKARWYQYPKLAISHPEPSYRLASWIAIRSFALGFISVLLGAWSVYLSYQSIT